MSNGPWQAKRAHFSKFDDVLITKDAVNLCSADWDIETIQQRTSLMIDQILQIWPVPDWYTGKQETVILKAPTMASVDVAELVASGWIKAGAILRHRNQNPLWLDARAVVSQSGRIFIDDMAYETPSAAAWAATGKPQNGWWWWAVDETGQSLSDVRADYLASMGEGDALVEDSEAEDADDEFDAEGEESTALVEDSDVPLEEPPAVVEVEAFLGEDLDASAEESAAVFEESDAVVETANPQDSGSHHQAD